MNSPTPWRLGATALAAKPMVEDATGHMVALCHRKYDAEDIIFLANSHAALEKVAQAAEKALIILMHDSPPKPNHICGSPDACCDNSCVDYARHWELIETLRIALAELEERK